MLNHRFHFLHFYLPPSIDYGSRISAHFSKERKDGMIWVRTASDSSDYRVSQQVHSLIASQKQSAACNFGSWCGERHSSSETAWSLEVVTDCGHIPVILCGSPVTDRGDPWSNLNSIPRLNVVRLAFSPCPSNQEQYMLLRGDGEPVCFQEVATYGKCRPEAHLTSVPPNQSRQSSSVELMMGRECCFTFTCRACLCASHLSIAVQAGLGLCKTWEAADFFITHNQSTLR